MAGRNGKAQVAPGEDLDLDDQDEPIELSLAISEDTGFPIEGAPFVEDATDDEGSEDADDGEQQPSGDATETETQGGEADGGGEDTPRAELSPEDLQALVERLTAGDATAADEILELPAFKAKRGEERRSLERNFSRRVEQLLAGDPEAEKSARAGEKRVYRAVKGLVDREVARVREQYAPPAAGPFTEQELASWDAFQELRRYRPEEFAAALDDDATRGSYEKWVRTLRAMDLSTTATSAEIKPRAVEWAAKRRADVAEQAVAKFDPDALYDQFMQRPYWAALEPAERDALHPDNFDGDPVERALKMTELMGEYKPRAVRRQRAEAAGTEADALTKAAAGVRAAAAKQPPLTTGRPGIRIGKSDDEIIENYTRDPGNESYRKAYAELRTARSWGS